VKILIVRGDPQDLETLATDFQLHWRNCTVFRAADGAEAIRELTAHEPNVVVLDVGLPRKSGFDVLRDLRRIDDVPVVMVSEHASESEEIRALQLGADDYVRAPFSDNVFFARIRSVLRRAEGTTFPGDDARPETTNPLPMRPVGRPASPQAPAFV
jgi:DNA-binding response OmpR family regulator